MISVKYSGPFAESSGYAQSNRNFIEALHTVGIDVTTELQQYSHHPTDYGKQLDLAKSLQGKDVQYPIKILHITPNVYAQHKEPGKYHIGHLFWETTGMAASWQKYLDDVDEIWTGCKFNEKCFREAGFKGPIITIPQPMNTNAPTETVPIIGASGYKFYSIFQWIERKNPKSLLSAYWKEFQHGEDVTLIIKTYGLSFEGHQTQLIRDQVQQWKRDLELPGYPKTLFIFSLLSQQNIWELHNSGDCFVSAHRGEGWGVPQAEALSRSKPVISTNLGGIHEWIPDDGMLKTKFEMVPVFNMKWAEQYAPDQQWAQVDENNLRQKMRFAFDHRNKAAEIGKKGNQYVKELLSFERVGNLMKNRLEKVYRERGFV